MAIIIYNKHNEEHYGDNVFDISRASVFGNPFTHIKSKETKAIFVVSDRDKAIDLYEPYFDKMYAKDEEFRNEFNRMYETYKGGEDIYLGCYCKPLRCHGEIIEKKLIQFSMKEKIKRAIKERRNI